MLCLDENEVNESNEVAVSSSSYVYESPSHETQRDSGKGVTFLSIKDRPYQPIINFKKEVVGDKRRSFNPSWYNTYCWLKYSVLKNTTYCFCCRLFCKEKSGKGENAFTQKGVSNWKKTSEKFRIRLVTCI